MVGGITYVELETLETWFGAPSTNPIARIMGGPDGAGGTLGAVVSLTLGDVIGAILLNPRPDNRGYFGLHPAGLFRKGSKDKGLTNAMHFTSTAATAQSLKKGSCRCAWYRSSRRTVPCGVSIGPSKISCNQPPCRTAGGASIPAASTTHAGSLCGKH